MDGRIIATVAVSLMLSGCSGGTTGDGNDPLAQEHVLARDLTVAVSAGGVWHMDFQTAGGLAQYDFRLTDDSSVDIGFIRTQNVENFAEGSASSVYGSHSDVRAASQSTPLDAGQWSLYIACNNAFADCDGILDYASFWS